MFPLNMELGAAFLSGGMAFFSWDLATDRLYGDAALADLFDVEAAEMAAGIPILSLIERISEDHRPRVAASIHRAITSGLLCQEQYSIDHGRRGVVDVISVGRCLKDAGGIPFIYNGTIMEVSVQARSVAADPLSGFCRSALELAERQGNDLAARYLSSALRVIGSA
jgi:PAS domain-containing protein